MSGELLEFPNGVMGMALNLEENNVGAVVLGSTMYKRGRRSKGNRKSCICSCW